MNCGMNLLIDSALIVTPLIKNHALVYVVLKHQAYFRFKHRYSTCAEMVPDSEYYAECIHYLHACLKCLNTCVCILNVQVYRYANAVHATSFDVPS